VTRLVNAMRFPQHRGVPTWVKIVVLVAAVALLGLLDWVINGSADFAIVGAVGLMLGGLLGLVLKYRRARDRA
jgi:membrane associated rhomboid family serine protease